MTPREIELYRWFETFTLHPEADAADPFLELALHRRYVERKKTGELAITEAGWEWFAVRCSQIITRCNAGFHLMRPRTPGSETAHCLWCGECEQKPCGECLRFYLGGTIEGGWADPLEPTYDTNPRSTITHGYDKP